MSSGANVFSIKYKKSNSKKYDEIGRHLIVKRELGEECNSFDSPFLIDCKGCEYNISRKIDSGKCLVYIEKDITIKIKGRKVKDNDMENMMKPYETCENINAMNDLAIEANMDVFKEKDQVIMRINNNVSDNIDICLMWLDYVIENKGMYEELREFVIVK